LPEVLGESSIFAFTSTIFLNIFFIILDPGFYIEMNLPHL
jgi:hypothetical protein